MATKVSQLRIQLQGAQTIEQLEETLNQVNDEIRQVDTNSDSFRELSKVAQQADAQLREVQGSLEGVTGQEQAESAKKLGEGLAGAFAAATVASSLFGEETAESVEQATQTALQLVVVLDGLEKASQAFSAETVKGLRSIVTGFRSSSVAAKLFGTTARTALTATGIGILVIAIGSLIANWETVSNAVKDFGSAAVDAIVSIFPPFQGVVDFVNDIIDKVGSLGNLFSALGAGIKGVFTAGTSAAEEFNKSLDEGKAAQKLADSLEKAEGISQSLNDIFKSVNKTVDQENNALDKQIKILERKAKLTNNEVEKAKIQDQIDLAILETRAEIAENAQRYADVFDRILESNRESLRETKLQLNTQLRQTENEEEIKELKEQILGVDKSILLTNEIESFLQEQIADALFVQDLRTKDIADKEKARLAEIERLNKLLQEGLKFIEEQNAELDESKAEQATKDFIEYRNAIAKAEEEARKLNEELDNLDFGDDPPEEQVDRYRISLLQALKVQRELNKEIRETGIELETNAERIERFKEEAIEAITTVGFAVIDGLQAPVQFIQNSIDTLTQELDVLNESLESSTENRLSLEEELANAQGRRFDLILSKLKQEKAREKELAQEKLAQEQRIADAKTRQAKLEKAQAITQATIQASVAVVEALPNIPLSVLIGAIGLANIAAIASQPIPEFAEGGYTGRGIGYRDGTGEEVAGVVHANEYVVPKHIVHSNPDMIATLEAMRTGKRGFADGGFVPDTSGGGGMTTQQLMSALGQARFQVAVSEFRDVSTEVDVIEDNSSF